MKFYAMHTVDELGARAVCNEGWHHGEFDNIFAAVSAIDGVLGGYVRREDGAVLAPDGSWIGERDPSAVALGRMGGSAKSPAKTAAARMNAKKGGWPKGKPRKPTAP